MIDFSQYKHTQKFTKKFAQKNSKGKKSVGGSEVYWIYWGSADSLVFSFLPDVVHYHLFFPFLLIFIFLLLELELVNWVYLEMFKNGEIFKKWQKYGSWCMFPQLVWQTKVTVKTTYSMSRSIKFQTCLIKSSIETN